MDLHILPLYPPPCPPSHDVPASETESLCHMDPLPAASPHPHYKHTPHLALQSLLFLESFLSLYINSLQKGSPHPPERGALSAGMHLDCHQFLSVPLASLILVESISDISFMG